ncbi:hypothetical protein OUZ56_027840 [Daphnia magna]|uniref:Enoyl reductase (ER) domain-containing protein n=1 Tax=Daphnia magna TaxID=35525 RepID=A0ABR0B249_9CRUS|nr:hypothetical protein OUZ56_027840 [Daphnia magna]
MLPEKHETSSFDTTSTPDSHTVNVDLDEHSSFAEDEPENGQRESSFAASEEVEREMQELRRRDEEKHRRMQKLAKNRIRRHVKHSGGDFSVLLNQDVPYDVKCVQLIAFGFSENIHTVKVPMPLPVKQEVLIRAHSCGVSFHDVLTRIGRLDNWARSLEPPLIMGSEVAGEVVALGKDVTEFCLGDRVMALPERNAWSQYVVCHVDLCFKIPEKMSYHEAVALTVDGIVAHTLLFHMGNLSPGEAVLMHSIPGGLDTMVTQMARTVPYTRIFKIAMDNEERQSESADKTVHKIVHDADYVSEIRQNSPNGVDLVLDWHYDDNFQRDFNLLRPMGKYVLFGDKTSFFQKIFEMAKSWVGQDKFSPLKLYEENKGICGFNLRSLLYFQKNRPFVRNVFDKICKMWQAGQIKAVFDCTLHFDDFTEALQHIQEHEPIGKIILDPTKTKGDLLSDSDYYLLAEKNVKRGQHTVNLPDVPTDKTFLDEEEAHVKHQQHEEQQRCHDYYGPGTEEGEGPPSYTIPEPGEAESPPASPPPASPPGEASDEPTSPTSKIEVGSSKHDIPSNLLEEEGEQQHGHGILEKLREAFSLYR